MKENKYTTILTTSGQLEDSGTKDLQNRNDYEKKLDTNLAYIDNTQVPGLHFEPRTCLVQDQVSLQSRHILRPR